MATNYDRVVYSVSAEDIEESNSVWYAWLCKQDEEKQRRVIDRFAGYLQDLFDDMQDDIYDCMRDAVRAEGFSLDAIDINELNIEED